MLATSLGVSNVRGWEEDVFSVRSKEDIAGVSNGSAVIPIADKPTRKDDALTSDVMALRRALLSAPEVQAEFKHLANLRSDVPGDNRAGQIYWARVELLNDALDGSWAPAEIDLIASRWNTPAAAQRRQAGLPPVAASLAYNAGRTSARGRRMTQETIGLAARSLVLRFSGLTASQADEQVAAEAFITDPSTIAGYRKRLRDRLA